MNPKTKKIASFLLISLFGVIIGIGISYYIALRLSVPVTSGEITIEGIDHPVEITFDSLGICQIWAESEVDAFFALGYQHAADRMFQMDVSRRLAGGRLSEMLGSIAVEIDTEQRRVGHHRIAREAMENLSEENKRRLTAYAGGVNAYARACRAMPFEYRFLPISFVDWTVEDCLSLLSFQTWFSNAMMSRNEFYLELERKIGPDRAMSLEFPYPDWAPVTVPPGLPEEAEVGDNESGHRTLGQIHRVNDAANAGHSMYTPFQHAIADALFSHTSVPMRMTEASNAWVIAPSKSASGKAMLASDPHLELTRLPQFWYMTGMHIKEDTTDVLGITTPGLPFFIMGHNGKAAWAVTAGGVDVVDFYEEQVNPENENQYRAGDEWLEFDITIDSFFVADIDSFITVEIRHTVNGIVASDAEDGQVTSFHWAGFDADLDEGVTNALELHRVSDFEQFRKNVTSLGALDANMLYADAAGNIGYQLTTPIPMRTSRRDTIARKWSEYYPLDATPHVVNPSNGWIASSNNLPQRLDYLNGHFFTHRIVSITQLLSDKDKFSTDDMRLYQMDRTDRYLLRFTHLAVNALESLGKPEQADMMRNWDGSTGLESEEIALMQVFLEKFKQLTFEDELGTLYHQVPDRWIEAIARVDSAGWFDDTHTADTVESQQVIATRAMSDALGITRGLRWGDIHSLSMRHPLAMIPILGGLLELQSGPEPWAGSAGTLCKSLSRQVDEGRFESIVGPSWRFVIDFANIDSVTVVLPAGISGNPMTDHFFDFYELWKTGQYWVVPFSYEKVKQRAASTLILAPPTDSL